MKEDLKDREEIKDNHTSPSQEESQETEQEKSESVKSAAKDVKEDTQEDKKESSSTKAKSFKKALKIIADLEGELNEARDQLSGAAEQILRLQADFENFRKRKAKEQADTIRFSNQELLINLLPVLDNFERTLKAIEKTDNLAAIKEGIELVSNSMFRQLNKVGLEPIDSIGKEFNSEIHEAISSIPVEDESQKGLVIDEVEKGYKLKERVIRFSKVIVGE